jgi:hypothetical protein
MKQEQNMTMMRLLETTQLQYFAADVTHKLLHIALDSRYLRNALTRTRDLYN